MGIHLFKASRSISYGMFKPSSSALESIDKASIPKGNPDPSDYRVLQSEQIQEFLILLIQYPNCTNYEGKKILVFRGVVLADLLKQKLIDPHFFENNTHFSPISRFKPDNEGWEMARKFVLAMIKDQ